jgi:hypothetical protein
MPCAASTYSYTGDLLQCVDNVHPDLRRRWDSYPADQRDKLWLDEFRLLEPDFDELCAMVALSMTPPQAINPQFRQYSPRHKLLMTLNWLAHVPTSRQMRNKFNVPHNSFTEVVLRPTVQILYELLFQSPATQLIKWPQEPAALQAIVDGFTSKYGLPGCAGAIDGSLIPVKKPRSKDVGGDADSFYGYKGFVSHLLLAVVDSNKLFTYVNAGSPECVGDAALYQHTQLRRNLDAGILNQIGIPVRIGDKVQHIKPFLVGNAAFALGTHMLKNFTPPPPAGSARSTFNIRFTNCRRRVEVAFGEPKGRWAMCKRNVFWNDMNFLKQITGVCCALHNFMTEELLTTGGGQLMVITLWKPCRCLYRWGAMHSK